MSSASSPPDDNSSNVNLPTGGGMGINTSTAIIERRLEALESVVGVSKSNSTDLASTYEMIPVNG